MDIKDIIGAINLDNYSSSPGYLGFYNVQENGQTREEIVDDFVDEFCSNSQLILASSLWVNSDLEYVFNHFRIGSVVRKKIKSMVSTGELVLQDTSPFVDYDSEEFSEFLDQCDKEFRVCTNLTKDLIKSSMSLVVLDSGVRGHVFIIDLANDLVIYPHEDRGFGFFSISGSSTTSHIAQALLARYGEMVSTNMK